MAAHTGTATLWGKPPLIPAILFILAPITWIVLEWYAVLGFDSGTSGYDFQIESLSDLGVDYRQIHPLKHYNVGSNLHAEQNLNFIQAGVCFALAQQYLLFATQSKAARGNGLVRTLKFLLSLVYVGGMVLMSRVHGGPREKHWQIIGWHWNGLAMAAIAGNLSTILAAVTPSVGAFESKGIYRLVSLVLGMLGLYSYYQFASLGKWNYLTKVGLWQRGTVYPVLAWEAITALSLIMANFSGNADTKGKKT